MSLWNGNKIVPLITLLRCAQNVCTSRYLYPLQRTTIGDKKFLVVASVSTFLKIEPPRGIFKLWTRNREDNLDWKGWKSTGSILGLRLSFASDSSFLLLLPYFLPSFLPQLSVFPTAHPEGVTVVLDKDKFRLFSAQQLLSHPERKYSRFSRREIYRGRVVNVCNCLRPVPETTGAPSRGGSWKNSPFFFEHVFHPLDGPFSWHVIKRKFRGRKHSRDIQSTKHSNVARPSLNPMKLITSLTQLLGRRFDE